MRCGARPYAFQMRCTEETLMLVALAMAAAVQCVASCGGSAPVRATTLSMISWQSGGTRDGRVLSRRSPSTPSSAKRSCQRQTQVLDVPVRRIILTVPTPSAESSTISARQTCFCEALRLLTMPSSRLRSEVLRLITVLGRMPQTRMPQTWPESPSGLNRQVRSTSQRTVYEPDLRYPQRRRQEPEHGPGSVDCPEERVRSVGQLHAEPH